MEIKITGNENEIANFLENIFTKRTISKEMLSKLLRLEETILENLSIKSSTERETKILRSM